ncbi:MAG: hypothetical protein HYV07_32290 [Deltaproteobacteria bacterium]|nr:hypothetical protein [Deltaproteobacteria bacterium]
MANAGWSRGAAQDYDAKLGLVPKDLFAFVEATQPELWAELRRQHKTSLEATVLDWLEKALETRGTLEVLRHGFKFYGKKIETGFFKPANALNPETLARYAKNRLVVTRQVRFVPDGDASVDMLFSLCAGLVAARRRCL